MATERVATRIMQDQHSASTDMHYIRLSPESSCTSIEELWRGGARRPMYASSCLSQDTDSSSSLITWDMLVGADVNCQR